jgi:predicted MPP superfamily phosphohydrolase
MSLAFVEKKEGVAAAPAGKVRITRRSLLAGAAGLIGLSAAGTAGYAAAIEPHSLVVTPYTLRPNGWPAGRRLTITVIADLHAGGPDMPLPQVQRIVDTANALKSDLIVMLGDYIARYDFAIERIPDPLWAAELARLQAPLGVWAILGNHDWWYDLAGVRNALAGAQIPLLENQAVLLGPEGGRFWVAGIGDQIAHRVGRGRFRGVDDLPGTL